MTSGTCRFITLADDNETDKADCALFSRTGTALEARNTQVAADSSGTSKATDGQ
jgi:hypothetical protein